MSKNAPYNIGAVSVIRIPDLPVYFISVQLHYEGKNLTFSWKAFHNPFKRWEPIGTPPPWSDLWSDVAFYLDLWPCPCAGPDRLRYEHPERLVTKEAEVRE